MVVRTEISNHNMVRLTYHQRNHVVPFWLILGGGLTIQRINKWSRTKYEDHTSWKESNSWGETTPFMSVRPFKCGPGPIFMAMILSCLCSWSTTNDIILDIRTPSHPRLWCSHARRSLHGLDASDEAPLRQATWYENVTNASGVITSSANLRNAR